MPLYGAVPALPCPQAIPRRPPSSLIAEALRNPARDRRPRITTSDHEAGVRLQPKWRAENQDAVQTLRWALPPARPGLKAIMPKPKALFDPVSSRFPTKLEPSDPGPSRSLCPRIAIIVADPLRYGRCVAQTGLVSAGRAAIGLRDTLATACRTSCSARTSATISFVTSDRVLGGRSASPCPSCCLKRISHRLAPR